MSFEDMQAAWKAQDPDPNRPFDLRLAAARRGAAKRRRTLFWRDAREIAAALIVAAIFVWSGLFQPPLAAFGSYFVAAIALAIGIFFLVDRRRWRAKTTLGEGSLASELQCELRAIDHQIWLLRNVGWWYLAPLNIGLMVWAVAIGIASPLPFWVFPPLALLIMAPISLFVYKLNQIAARKTLVPERDEIMRLLQQWKAVEDQ